MKKRLLHISANQLPYPDQDYHTVNIWKELAKGFDEYHIIGRSWKNRFEKVKMDNICLHLVPAFGKRNRSFFFSSFYIFHIIRKYKITHLMSQSSIWGGFAATNASRFFRIPLMVEIHGDVYFKYFRSNRIIEKILGKISLYVLRRANKIRSLGPQMTLWLKELGFDKTITEIPNRVNTSIFQPTKESYSLNDPINILSIGRFVPQKGYDIAIKTINELSKKQNVVLRLIGGGKMLEELRSIDNSDGCIEYIEWIDQKELVEIMRETDIYIQPSKPWLGEAMPRTILEAMAMGLPIIASEMAAIPGILIHERNALLVKPGNELALSVAIERLINDREIRKNLGKEAASDAAEKYEWHKMFDLYRYELTTMKYEDH